MTSRSILLTCQLIVREGALCRVAETLNNDDGVIVQQLAQTIGELVQELENTHEYFFRLHHPHRAEFEHEGWPSSEPE